MHTPLVSGFAQLPDTRIHYEIYGQGPSVLLLHGNGEDLHIFDCILDYLSAYRVVALDTRGHGRSGRGSKPMNFQTFADDVAAVLFGLEIPTAHVIGFSDGGNTALHLALAAPKRVRSMILLGANLNPHGIRWVAQSSIVMSYLAYTAVAKIHPSLAAKREIWGIMVREPRLRAGQLAGITAPTLVVAGERDIVKPAHTAEIAAAIPGAIQSILPGLDHFVLSKPDQLMPAILAFLQQQNPLQQDANMRYNNY